ncbi:MAG TPA: hypothetical protein VMD91_13670 [Candidatus Sulfotelmatobacter sp.]|nr:hypothetical protein [Candidatus Sulfotelmatobacter sp.]
MADRPRFALDATLVDVAFAVSTALLDAGENVVLCGGSAATFYRCSLGRDPRRTRVARLHATTGRPLRTSASAPSRLRAPATSIVPLSRRGSRSAGRPGYTLARRDAIVGAILGRPSAPR